MMPSIYEYLDQDPRVVAALDEATLRVQILNLLPSWHAMLLHLVPKMTKDQLLLLNEHICTALNLLRDPRRRPPCP
jgi:hypothetical protein